MRRSEPRAPRCAWRSCWQPEARADPEAMRLAPDRQGYQEQRAIQVSELGTPKSCVASLPLPLDEKPAGETPGTSTPPLRSSSPSSDGCLQTWAGYDIAYPPLLAPGSNDAAEEDTYKASPRDAATEHVGTSDGCGEESPQPVSRVAGAAARWPPAAGADCEAAAAEKRNAAAAGCAGKPAARATPPVLCVQIPVSPLSCSDLTDRGIIEGLAASEQTHRRLLRTAHRARTMLCANGHAQPPPLELYGSLALCASGLQSATGRECLQDWPRHFVGTDSDVDLVLLLHPDIRPNDLVQRLIGRGRFELVNQTSLKKFVTTQFSLRTFCSGTGASHSEVWLDLTCICSPLHFERFKGRQEAFRQAFRSARLQLEASHGVSGAMAFDAYIYLLKAFAAKVAGNALSGFQATCLGLFALQLHLYQLRCSQPTGLVLFECFLRFCSSFFEDYPADHCMRLRSYQCCAIDLSLGGRLLPRFSNKWRCEVYFLGVEVQLGTKMNERMNVAHSVVPEAVCAAAKQALAETVSVRGGRCVWS
mmetsp:Transcript_41510/g.129091  ORF Transcript_41510/g.129091 Transcript_41510/m.129091 type:complete len:533 (+) Transcript_41510:59-1657(+)